MGVVDARPQPRPGSKSSGQVLKVAKTDRQHHLLCDDGFTVIQKRNKLVVNLIEPLHHRVNGLNMLLVAKPLGIFEVEVS